MTQQSTEPEARSGPPMPRFMMKLMNPLLAALLRSPFHGRFSQQLMLLTFIGKKTGKRYTTPVGYVRQDDHLIVFTHSAWWKNFRGGAPVSMWIAGKPYRGRAVPVTDPAQIKDRVKALIESHPPERARQMGFWVDNIDSASPQQVLEAVRGVKFVDIQFED